MTSLEALAFRALRAAGDVRFHRQHRGQAAAVLASVESERGATDPALIKACDDYAGDVLGRHGYAPWLRVYAAVAGEFRTGWIPDNYYGRIVLPAVQGPYGEVSKLKPLSRRLLQTDLLADVAYWVNGGLYGRDLEHLDRADLVAVLFADSDRVVFKSDDSVQGQGVRILDRAGFGADGLARLPSGVFQTYVRQHPLFAEFTPASVATIRITTTVTDDGGCRVRAAYLRLGRASDTHVQSTSHLRVALDPETGAFADDGFTTDWRTLTAHPDTGVTFAGNRAPGFGSCTAAVVELHRRMPFARNVGWDVVVDSDDEVKVLEWNAGHNDIKFSEAVQGPCFADLGWETLWRTR
ncbi:hypothetical protein GCM10009836_58010 [Pseudonocardia ailaonensis]|uniref:Alpha-L-glutamate ligase-related protein ATP-grasp domain-containing protein n=1 Tax=Pseudonocardia ailaonensis TaxID=367279 RepID=A0ABN2NHR8_9PSEU